MENKLKKKVYNVETHTVRSSLLLVVELKNGSVVIVLIDFHFSNKAIL